MKWACALLILFLLIACEKVPETTEETKPEHKISLDISKISHDPLFPGSILSYNYTLLNIGREDVFDVALETRIRKKTTGEIVKTEGEIVSMALVSFKEKGIALPADLSKGEYEIAVVATYDSGTDSDAFTFSVDREEPVVEIKNTTETKNKTDMHVAVEKTPEPTATQGTGPTVNVLIQDYQYHPRILNITVGTTVVWYNNDSVPHSASGAGFDSGPIARGNTFSFTFTKPVTKIYSSTYTQGPQGTIYIHQ